MKFNVKYLLILGLIGVLMGAAINFIPVNKIMAGDEVQGKIAYVDIQEVFNVHPDKDSAEKKLNELARTMQEDLEKKARELSEEEQQEMLSEYQKNLSEEEQGLIQNILADIDEAINTVAEEKQVKMVLDKKNVVYGGYNMTQDVIDYIKNK